MKLNSRRFVDSSVFIFDNNVVYYFVLFQIPADSALVFGIELLKIERKEEL